MSQVFTQPFQQTLDDNGKPISGALLYFYVTGTLNAQTVWTTSAQTVAHPQPVVADAAGRFAPIYMDSSLTYRVRVCRSDGSIIRDIDPISNQSALFLSLTGGTITGNIVTAGIYSTSGTIEATSPNSSTTGAFRMRGNDAAAVVFFQITNAAASAEWGHIAFGSTGIMDWSGSLNVQGTISASSDKRFKTHIETIDNALDLVRKLRGVSFIKDECERIGVIAQEVGEHIPEVVHEDHKGFLSVDYGALVAPLIEAVKELADRVERLEA